MNQSRRNLTRFVALCSAAVVIGIPIALIAATWEPLEPRPRAGRADAGNTERAPNSGDTAPAATPSERKRPRKRDTREEAEAE